jgi:glycerate 2-kinase
MPDRHPLLDAMLKAALAAADPMTCVPPHLPARPEGRTVVVGAGKASAAMAKAVEAHWEGPLEGLVITRYGHGVACERIEIVEAAHPVPDEAGRQAAARMPALVSGLTPDDLVLCLISGGGSALLAAPAPGLTLVDKQDVNRQLLASGANIHEMNCLRKHLSALKGGRLAAAAAPARVVTLLISDIPGDDPASVASGPTVPDPTTSAQALAIVDKYKLDLAPHVLAHLRSEAAETPKPGDAVFAGNEVVMVATPAMAIAAAAYVARAAGFAVHDLGDAVEGEAREVAATRPRWRSPSPTVAARWPPPPWCCRAARPR